MKILILLTIILLNTTIYSHCGSCSTDFKKTNKKHHHKEIKNEQQLMIELNISKETEEKYNEINKTFSKKLFDMQKEYKEKKNELKNQYKEEIKGILTKEQFEKYDNYLNKNHSH